MQMITGLIKVMWETSKVPENMKKSYIVLLPKKKGSKLPQDMRPITLINSTYKLLDKLSTTRLKADIQAKRIMHEAQADFTDRISCPGQILILNTIIDYQNKQEKPTYCAYLDLAKAFDSLDIKILFETMRKRNLDDQVIRILREMYTGEKSAIIINGRPGKWIDIRKGVRKGGCSSPICFNFIPNELAFANEESPYGIILPNGKKIGILLYADDIVLLSSSTSEMQGLCSLVEKWLNSYKLNINLSKSEIVAYGVKKKPVITIKGCVLQCSASYKYLGYIADKRLRGKAHLTERKEKMKMALSFFLEY